jgi:hypothetical protein
MQAIREEVRSGVREFRSDVKEDVKEELKINRILDDFYNAINVAKDTELKRRDWRILTLLSAQVKDIFIKNKLNRKAAILSARFIRSIQHERADPAGNAQAIEVLDEFLVAKRIAGQRDHDYAFVLYNRACYSATIAASAANGELIRHETQALTDLQEAVNLAPDLARVARTDLDFAGLFNDPDFKKIIAPAGEQQAN